METPRASETEYRARIEATLTEFAGAWSRCDIDALMALVGEQPCYRTSGGLVFEGREAVRQGFEHMCKPAAPQHGAPPQPPPPHFFGNMCISYWYVQLAAGSPPVPGIDILIFDEDAKVISKDAYRKLR
jgi:hypothetical protein